jgi:hypothetical protein
MFEVTRRIIHAGPVEDQSGTLRGVNGTTFEESSGMAG